MKYVVKPVKYKTSFCYGPGCDCKSESSSGSYCYCNQPNGYSACTNKKS